MNNSVILQVDESTKGLMEEIQTGITSSIEDGLRDVKGKVETVDDNTEMILHKFKNFDGLSSSIENLRALAEQSKKFSEIVSPLQNNVYEIKQETKTNQQTLSQAISNIALLVKGVVELGDKQKAIDSGIRTELQKVSTQNSEESKSAKESLGKIIEELNQADKIRQELYDRINGTLANVSGQIDEVKKSLVEKTDKIENQLINLMGSQKDFISKYSDDEASHKTYEEDTASQIATINNSLEKVQATLDIIVNLVTPFWKKW